MRSIHKGLYILIISILIISCQRESTLYSSDITGKVTEENGTPIQEATVTVGKQATQTDSEGIFYLKDIKYDILSINKEGYYSEDIILNIIPGTIKKMGTITLIADQKQKKPITITPSILEVNVFEGSSQVYFDAGNLQTELICKEKWLQTRIWENTLYVWFEENPTTEKRIAHVILKAIKEDIQDTLTVIQDAGPILNIIDYSGRNETYTFPQEMPFIKFNRPVKLLDLENVKVSSVIYEEDSTIIRFPDIQPYLLKTISYYYSVQSQDGQTYNGNFTVIPPYKYQTQTKDMIFTKDNQYCWLLAQENWEPQLIQLETKNYSTVKKIPLEDKDSKLCYNPYNNCIYIYDENICIIDAETGILRATLSKPIEMNYDDIHSMDFCYNGFGLLQGNSKLFTINSAQNHQMELYPVDNDLYQSNQTKFTTIKSGNNRRQFILFDSNTIKEVFCLDVDTKKHWICFNDNPNYANYRNFCQPHKREPYIIVAGQSSDKIYSINTITGEKIKYNNYYNDYSIHIDPLPLETTIPWNHYALIQNGTLIVIERNSGKEVHWEQLNENTQWTNYSSEDGSIMAFTNRTDVYFIKAGSLLP